MTVDNYAPLLDLLLTAAVNIAYITAALAVLVLVPCAVCGGFDDDE